jgi:hypothetical protein
MRNLQPRSRFTARTRKHEITCRKLALHRGSGLASEMQRTMDSPRIDAKNQELDRNSVHLDGPRLKI